MSFFGITKLNQNLVKQTSMNRLGFLNRFHDTAKLNDSDKDRNTNEKANKPSKSSKKEDLKNRLAKFSFISMDSTSSNLKKSPIKLEKPMPPVKRVTPPTDHLDKSSMKPDTVKFDKYTEKKEHVDYDRKKNIEQYKDEHKEETPKKSTQSDNKLTFDLDLK